MSTLAGKVALVTGASRGIGSAIAVAFAAEGADVVVTARTTAALESLGEEIAAQGREALPISADLASAGAVERIVGESLARFGRIDILVNNAALIHERLDLLELEPALWREVIEVNLVAPALLTRAVLPGMIAQGSGKVINISSIGGRVGAAGRSAYRAAKAGVINLTESVAAEVKKHGIDVNCICPGSVETEGFLAVYGQNAPAGRPHMKPSQIAAIAVFLAGDGSSALTGTAIDAFGWSNPLFNSRY